MKKLITSCFVLAFAFSGYSQFKIEAGATVTMNGTATLVLQDVDLVNEGTLNTGTSTIIMKGAADNDITSGGATIHNLSLEKDAGQTVSLTDNMIISNELAFGTNDNKLVLGANDLNLEAAATVTGADSDDYVVTGGTGAMVKEGLAATAFEYPVGFDVNTYNPITIAETGAADDIGVRVLENAFDDGTSSGVVLTEEVVNASWEVTEGTAGGSSLDVTAEWAASDETGDLDRTMSGIARYDGVGYDLTLANTGAAAGSDPYTQNRTGVEPGTMIVAGEANFDDVKVSPVVVLEGPNVSGLMNDGLRVLDVIPAAEPYTGLGFMHEGLGGGEVIANPTAVFGVTGNDAIVDWVFVELRASADATNVVATRSALIQRDGDIVDIDGTSPLEFKGFADGDYFIAVRHRLHLGFRTSGAKSLTGTATSLNFADGTEGTFGVDALKDLGGTFVMYSGNGNYDSTVNSIDNTQFWFLQNGLTYNYVTSSADFTMDGTVNSIDKVQHWRLNNGTIEQLD